MDQVDKIRDDSPQQQSPSFIESQQSHDVLVSKHLIPPPLMLLPKPTSYEPKSLLPMIPLPAFVGIIPNFQPLDAPLRPKLEEDKTYFNWIGDAFDNVVYRKYQEASYCKIDDAEQNWNIWACDVLKLSQPQPKSQTNNNNNTNNKSEDQSLKPFYIPKNQLDRTLVFQSRFQSGNLSLASKVTENQYNLLLQNDINTNGYSQWFFFKVSNTIKGMKVKFHILNLYKNNSLYKSGMKIIIYSTKQSQQKNISWHRGGENIQYFQNGYSKSTTQYTPFYTLSWDYIFPHSGDQVYFAYSYPFTYTNLNNLIQKIQSDHFTRNICRRVPLCKTIAGNKIDILTITQDHPFQDLEKDYIVITARIHPGESVSSYVCNGILQFLLSNDQKAKKLRQHFIFKIIPMLNPDGVIHGNYRSNISGFDLNRKWENPSKIYHPQVYYCKKLIQSLNQIGRVVLFCDLHGHSMKKNAFIYGSHDSLDPRKGKQFPYLMSKLFRGFSFRDCSFLKKQEKQGTTRTVLAKQIFQNNVYTLQSSFCGPQYENIHFTVRHFEQLGQKFCQTILLTFKQRIKQMHITAAMKNNSANLPITQHDKSKDLTQLEYESLIDFQQIDDMNLRERVNSQNSQGDQPQNQKLSMLEQKTIKKYLIVKNTRPQTSMGLTLSGSLHGRRGEFFRKVGSKDLTVKFQRKAQFIIHKSNSPTKRKQLYEAPPPKAKLTLQKTEKAFQKMLIEPKLFQPIQFMSVGLQKEKKKNYRSSTKLGSYGSESDRTLKRDQKTSNIKLVLNKNYEFNINTNSNNNNSKQQQQESVFKNSTLKVFLKDQIKNPIKQRRASDFVIRKNNKISIMQEKGTTNLFKSVLSSLRKDKK